MFLRIAVVAPLALAAILPAQLTPSIPKQATLKPQTPVAPAAQAQSPAERLEQLKKAQARLQREISFTSQRVKDAKTLLASKMRRDAPSFRSIDAGKPAAAMPIAPRAVTRQYAHIGTKEQMSFGDDTAMVKVNRRAISQASFDTVMNYVRKAANSGNDRLHAQRVLFDMIRIEAVADQFEENEGEIKMSENLLKLENGTKKMGDAAKEFGSVQGASEDGAVQVTRNSPHGPYFEHVAFSTPVGKVSRPFRSTQGYVVLKVDSIEKGAQPQLDKVHCHVVQFSYTPDKESMQKAQFQVNSGQVQILVRDQEVMDMLPALFRPPASRVSPRIQLQKQITNLETYIKSLENPNNPSALSADEVTGINDLRVQLKALKQQLQAIPLNTNVSREDTDGPQKTSTPKRQVKPAKKGPVENAPVKKGTKVPPAKMLPAKGGK